jgi:hypothetical protein
LQQKTTGITYNNTSETTNTSKNINVANLVNTIESATRNNGAFGESVAIGSNLVVGKNIINSGDIHTNTIYAKSLLIRDAVIENTILTKAFIGDIPLSPQKISFINTLTSDVQLQLDTNSKKIGPAGKDGLDGSSGTNGTNGLDGSLGTNGLDGSPGANGSNGLDGSPGVNGLDGSPGTNGSNGLNGSPGANGLDGSPGSNGSNGLDGKDGLNGKDGINSTLGAYILNRGVGAFPIYGSIDNFEALGMNRYRRSEKESFLVLPRYRLILYSADNKFIQLTNSSFVDMQYFNIDSITQTTSCKNKTKTIISYL